MNNQKLLELAKLGVKNKEATLNRITENCIASPFPESLYHCQPIKNRFTEIERAWIGKIKPIKSMRIFASVATYDDQVWYHVSFSFKDKLPNYEQVIWVRDNLFKSNSQVVQVFPPRKDHVNFHPYTLHLWENLEAKSIPDFAVYGLI